MDFNKVILTGRITQDPALKMAGDREYCGFQIAINRYKDTGVDFVKVATFGHTAEFVSQYVNKGDLLLVEGRLQNHEWQGQDGVKRRSTEIIANSVQLMRKKNQTDETNTFYGGVNQVNQGNVLKGNASISQNPTQEDSELPGAEATSDTESEIANENDDIPF